MTQNSPPPNDHSPWPHRLACLLVCATFPLIWVGGLVTTTDAGMAVPDWPNTYGYNLFLYPWQTWLAAPWDLFIEHGHRLFAALVGLVTILMAVVLWRREPRLWVRELGVIAVFAVLIQGGLGGLRVIHNERLLAMVHGCFGPAFFALCVALAVVTSRFWKEAADRRPSPGMAKLARLALVTTVLVYLQLVLGALLRHADPAASSSHFQAMVVFHVGLALVVVAHGLWIAVRTWTSARNQRRLVWPASLLGVLVLAQLLLGGATWVLKYNWPAWFTQFGFAQGHLNVSTSMTEVLVTTAHVAGGSLILAVSLLLCLRPGRLARGVAPSLGAVAWSMGSTA